ncbi:MAG: hypothetical protein PQJ46_01705 [Spirochaetales bacterium]|nr:hypothetical protein [Spirochaetales bacterium]
MRIVLYMSVILLFFTSFHVAAYDSASESTEDKYVTAAYGLGFDFTSFNTDLTSTYQNILQSEGYSDPEVFYNISSVALNALRIIGKLPEEKKISAILYFELGILIQAGEINTIYKDDSEIKAEESLSYYDGGTGVDFIMGPGINYHPFKNFYLIAAGGTHLKGFLGVSSDSDYSFFTMASLGIGTVIMAEYRFSNNVGVMLGFNSSYNLLNIQYGLDDDYYDNFGGSSFSVTPSIFVTITNKMKTKLKKEKATLM